MQAYTENIKNYIGNATNEAQPAVNAYAAQNNYTLFSMDISAVCLKGMTFKGVARETGDTLRSVQFDFPPPD
eukprot:12904224-Prorocentrum_lima.AAC.1